MGREEGEEVWGNKYTMVSKGVKVTLEEAIGIIKGEVKIEEMEDEGRDTYKNRATLDGQHRKIDWGNRKRDKEGTWINMVCEDCYDYHEVLDVGVANIGGYEVMRAVVVGGVCRKCEEIRREREVCQGS